MAVELDAGPLAGGVGGAEQLPSRGIAHEAGVHRAGAFCDPGRPRFHRLHRIKSQGWAALLSAPWPPDRKPSSNAQQLDQVTPPELGGAMAETAMAAPITDQRSAIALAR